MTASAFKPLELHVAIARARGIAKWTKAVLHALTVHTNRSSGVAYPSVRTLSQETGWSVPRVISAIREAEKEGLLRFVQGRQHKPSEYRLQLSAFGALADGSALHPLDHSKPSSDSPVGSLKPSTSVAPVGSLNRVQRSTTGNPAFKNGDSSDPTVAMEQVEARTGRSKNRYKPPSLPPVAREQVPALKLEVTTPASTAGKVAARKRSKKPADEKPSTDLTALKDFYFAIFLKTKHVEANFARANGTWARAMKAFKALLETERTLDRAKDIIITAFRDETRLQRGWIEPWHIADHANDLRTPPKKKLPPQPDDNGPPDPGPRMFATPEEQDAAIAATVAAITPAIAPDGSPIVQDPRKLPNVAAFLRGLSESQDAKYGALWDEPAPPKAEDGGSP